MSMPDMVSPHHLPKNHVPSDLQETADEIGEGLIVSPSGEIEPQNLAYPKTQNTELKETGTSNKTAEWVVRANLGVSLERFLNNIEETSSRFLSILETEGTSNFEFKKLMIVVRKVLEAEEVVLATRTRETLENMKYAYDNKLSPDKPEPHHTTRDDIFLGRNRL